MATVQKESPNIPSFIIPSLQDLLTTPDDVPHYAYDITFAEAEKNPCLVLHSSGSTGDPKLVTMTHGTFAVTDNDRYMKTPEGRAGQNGTQFNFDDGGRFYSCFPPYHVRILTFHYTSLAFIALSSLLLYIFALCYISSLLLLYLHHSMLYLYHSMLQLHHSALHLQFSLLYPQLALFSICFYCYTLSLINQL